MFQSKQDLWEILMLLSRWWNLYRSLSLCVLESKSIYAGSELFINISLSVVLDKLLKFRA